MIFRPELVRLIKRGKKTATRRPLKPYIEPSSPWIVRRDGTRRRRPPAKVVQIDGAWYRQPPTLGASVAVQPGRGKLAETRIVITAVARQRLGDLTFDDARAEGFRTTDAFKAYWTRLYEPALNAGVDDVDENGVTCEPVPEDLLVERFDARHADTAVWAITFELDGRHRPRLLAQPGRGELDGEVRDYTHDPNSALRGTADAGEAIDADLLRHYTADAHDRLSGLPGRREEQLRKSARSLSDSMRALANGRTGIDVPTVLGQLEQLQQHLQLLEQNRRRAA